MKNIISEPITDWDKALRRLGISEEQVEKVRKLLYGGEK